MFQDKCLNPNCKSNQRSRARFYCCGDKNVGYCFNCSKQICPKCGCKRLQLVKECNSIIPKYTQIQRLYGVNAQMFDQKRASNTQIIRKDDNCCRTCHKQVQKSDIEYDCKHKYCKNCFFLKIYKTIQNYSNPQQISHIISMCECKQGKFNYNSFRQKNCFYCCNPLDVRTIKMKYQYYLDEDCLQKLKKTPYFSRLNCYFCKCEQCLKIINDPHYRQRRRICDNCLDNQRNASSSSNNSASIREIVQQVRCLECRSPLGPNCYQDSYLCQRCKDLMIKAHYQISPKRTEKMNASQLNNRPVSDAPIKSSSEIKQKKLPQVAVAKQSVIFTYEKVPRSDVKPQHSNVMLSVYQSNQKVPLVFQIPKVLLIGCSICGYYLEKKYLLQSKHKSQKILHCFNCFQRVL